MSISEIATEKGIKSQKVYTTLDTIFSKLLSKGQKQSMKVAREMAAKQYILYLINLKTKEVFK